MSGALAFFGAFNPPTLAHLDLALFALRATGRERVIFVPSKASYIQKEQGKDFAFSDADRLAMLRAAAEARPWMGVTDWEILSSSQPRTYITLCHLREEGDAPALLMGSDKLAELETGWRYVDKIAREFGIVCLARGKDDCEGMIRDSEYLRALAPFIRIVETPAGMRDISSTAVRQKLRQKGSAREIGRLVPAEILPFLNAWAEGQGGETQ